VVVKLLLKRIYSCIERSWCLKLAVVKISKRTLVWVCEELKLVDSISNVKEGVSKEAEGT
jgi:hypothetical protein